MIPRLTDAEFFFKQDKKQPLDSFNERLKNVIFQAQLGSVYDKALRVSRLAAFIAERTEVSEMVRHALAFEQQGAKPRCPRRRGGSCHCFERHRISPGIRHRRVAGHAAGKSGTPPRGVTSHWPGRLAASFKTAGVCRLRAAWASKSAPSNNSRRQLSPALWRNCGQSCSTTMGAVKRAKKGRS